MRRIFNFSIIFVMLFTFNQLFAQNQWSLEIRNGASFATQDLGDADLNTGFGFEAVVAYRIMPHLAAYAGWGWNQFSADESFAGADMDFEETGYTFGLQFIHPIADTKLKYMVRAGGIYNHIETENNKGDIISDSGHGFGFQIGAGVSIPLTQKISLIPSIRYRSLSREIEVGSASRSVDLNYLSTGIGIYWTF